MFNSQGKLTHSPPPLPRRALYAPIAWQCLYQQSVDCR